MENFKMPADDLIVNENQYDEAEERKGPDMQEDMDPEATQRVQEAARLLKEAQEFKALLSELVFISKHPKNEWKRKESAILLLGTFIKDVSAFLIRNPYYAQL